MVLERIKGPADVKRLSPDEMKTLAAEMRDALLHKVSARGGHFGPNFGMVEATIALHYVFNSPEDKIVFDVSHQSYPHKMLTGRADAFLYPEKYNQVSGYSEPTESEHDHFVIGHTSTSISLASGLVKGHQCHVNQSSLHHGNRRCLVGGVETRARSSYHIGRWSVGWRLWRKDCPLLRCFSYESIELRRQERVCGQSQAF